MEKDKVFCGCSTEVRRCTCPFIFNGDVKPLLCLAPFFFGSLISGCNPLSSSPFSRFSLSVSSGVWLPLVTLHFAKSHVFSLQQYICMKAAALLSKIFSYVKEWAFPWNLCIWAHCDAPGLVQLPDKSNGKLKVRLQGGASSAISQCAKGCNRAL